MAAVAVGATTAVVSLAFGLLLGDSVNRALSVGFYLAATLSIIMGVFLGIRPPVRQEGDAGATRRPLRDLRERDRVRFATPEEREDSIAGSAVFVVLGFVLIFFGLLCDGRHPLA